MRNVHFWQLVWSAFVDCLSSREHSQDFNFYRSEILVHRARMFALLFGLATPVWIPIDRWLLPEEAMGALMALRLLTGVALLLLALWKATPTLKSALLRIAVFVLITLAFYLVVEVLTGTTFRTPGLIGYTALPLLLVAVLALFPLTLIESVLLQLAVGAAVIGLHHSLGLLDDRGVLGLLWILLLFSGFALLAQGIQLHLLMLIHRQATRDNLTGLFNRGALLRHATLVVEEGKRRNTSYAVLMVDLDRFKMINDTYGHLAGDNVLRAVAGVLDSDACATCLPGRFGGEEFMLLMCNTTLPQALEYAEQLRSDIAGLAIDTGAGLLSVTTSVGVALSAPGEAIAAVMHRADQALYAAKDGGRNRVVSAQEVTEQELLSAGAR